MTFRAAAAAAFVLAAATPAAAAEDPAVAFMGICIQQGSPAGFCACTADALTRAMTPQQMAIWNDYMAFALAGETDAIKIRDALKAKHGVDGKTLAAALKAGSEASMAANQACLPGATPPEPTNPQP